MRETKKKQTGKRERGAMEEEKEGFCLSFLLKRVSPFHSEGEQGIGEFILPFF